MSLEHIPGFEDDDGSPLPGFGAKTDKAVTRRPQGEAKPSPRPAKAEPKLEPASGIVPIRFTEYADRQPPERRFIADQWLPAGCVTSLYGPGGIGKSLLAQQLATCIATGRDFFGAKVEQGPVLGLMAEDDDDELWRRQIRINDALGCGMAELGDLHLQGRAGLENTLALYPASGAPTVESFFGAIQGAARLLKPKLIILDPIAQLYGGNENDRFQVSHFCNLVGGLAREFDCAVLLLGHPAKAEASEYSGSTAWNASVRSRLLLQRKEGEEEGQLIFSRVKSNYAKPDSLDLCWSGSVLRPVAPKLMTLADRIDAEAHAGAARQAFLNALDRLTEEGSNLSNSERATNYAPKVMLERALVDGFSRAELIAAMISLLNDRRIEPNRPVGRGTDRHVKYGLARVGGSE